jgi:hypothetical protein
VAKTGRPARRFLTGLRAWLRDVRGKAIVILNLANTAIFGRDYAISTPVFLDIPEPFPTDSSNLLNFLHQFHTMVRHIPC